MPLSAEITRGTAAQAVGPSSETADQLGGSGANISVSAGTLATVSGPAPRDGLMIVGMPNGFDCRVRLGSDPVALATDAQYFGPYVWNFPVKAGERISIFGGDNAGVVTVCMAR